MRREDLFAAIGRVEESRLARCEKHMNPSADGHWEDSNMKKGGKYADMFLKQAENYVDTEVRA